MRIVKVKNVQDADFEFDQPRNVPRLRREETMDDERAVKTIECCNSFGNNCEALEVESRLEQMNVFKKREDCDCDLNRIPGRKKSFKKIS